MSNPYDPELVDPTTTKQLRYAQCFVNKQYGANSDSTYVNYREEMVITGPEGKTKEPAGECGMQMTDANKQDEFDILNAATGLPVGTMTYKDIMQAINSFYRHCAAIRDAAAVP